MILTYEDDQVLVVDEFLSYEIACDFWGEIQELDYRSWRSEIWHKHYLLDTGDLFEGETIIDVNTTATGNAMRYFIDKINNSQQLFARIVGAKEKDWDIFTSRVAVMPMGSCLSWHEDGGAKSGAFVYYAHPIWRARWGGELMVAKRPTDAMLASAHAAQKNRKPFFDTGILDKLLGDPGVGMYISPKPNRLILLKSGTWHCVNRVEPAAGDNLRVSVAGFFWKLPNSESRS